MVENGQKVPKMVFFGHFPAGAVGTAKKCLIFPIGIDRFDENGKNRKNVEKWTLSGLTRVSR